MTIRFAALSLLVPSVALAQAPGETYYAQPPGQVAPAAPQVIVVPTTEVDPMADRFAVNLNLGGFSIAPDGADEGQETDFSVAELQVRFRATRRLEILLAFAGGRQQLDNDEQGELAMDQVTLGLRFNFRPEHHWNWYVMGGFGSTLIAPHDTPEEAREDMRRAHGVLGIGAEYRWQRFGITAELRGIGVAEDEDMVIIQDAPARDGNLMDGRELGGGQFTLGGSFYF